MTQPPTDPQRPINVIIAVDFSDAILDEIRAVSPRLRIERHFPAVPEKAWADAEILYTIRALPQPEQAPRLRWIQFHSAGIDHALKQPIMQAADVEVTNASGIHAAQMTEFCLMMMLAFTYKLPLLLKQQAAGLWEHKPVDNAPFSSWQTYNPRELRGQTLGIVGYGSVGRELARVADALGMTVVAAKRSVMQPAETNAYTEPGTGDPEGEIPRRIYPFEALTTMVKECDFLVLTVPLTAQTRYLVNEEVLSAMKKTAILINVARGAIVDEAALISTLAAGKIGGAALDVFEEEPLPAGSPLWNLDNVIISPHIAGNSARYHEKAAALFIENLERYLENRPLLNVFQREQGY